MIDHTTVIHLSLENYKQSCRHADLYSGDTAAGSALDNTVTLTFDPLISGSVHVEGLPWTIYLPTLLLIV